MRCERDECSLADVMPIERLDWQKFSEVSALPQRLYHATRPRTFQNVCLRELDNVEDICRVLHAYLCEALDAHAFLHVYVDGEVLLALAPLLRSSWVDKQVEDALIVDL